MKEPVGLFGLFKIINRVLFVINFSSSSIFTSKLSFSFSSKGTGFAPVNLIMER